MTRYAWLLIGAVALGCATGSSPESTAAKTPDAAPRMTVAAPVSCVQIRRCQQLCKSEKACESTCVAGAPAEAQVKLKAVNACSMKVCPQNDITCRCGVECMMPSDCADLLDQCTDGLEDPFCAAYCRSG